LSPVFRHGSLRLYLLRLLDEEPRHGYEVIRLLRDRFMGVYSPSPGTIYPRLARLEEEGLVTHDEVDGRKVYRITEAGREELRSRSDELDELEEELSASVSDIVREVREDVRQTVRSLREELTWAARESRRMGRDLGADLREQARTAREEARDQARTARDEAYEQARMEWEDARDRAREAREEAREQAREASEQAREARPAGEPGQAGHAEDTSQTWDPRQAEASGSAEQGDSAGASGSAEQGGQAGEGAPGGDWARSRAESIGQDAARRVRERARRLREEAQRVREESSGNWSAWDRIREGAGARFNPGDQNWEAPGWSGFTDWQGRHGWEDWARGRGGRRGWPGPLDLATLRDLERLAVQFTSDIRRLATQSTSAGENVISDLRSILEEALERIKTEIFGSSHEPGRRPTAGMQDAPGPHDAADQPSAEGTDAPDRPGGGAEDAQA
jgi:DNA-binding PadR family transcriptional regulator